MLIQVYRQLDVTEPDHAGNREYKPGFFETDEEAQALADSLNTKHWKISYSSRPWCCWTRRRSIWKRRSE